MTHRNDVIENLSSVLKKANEQTWTGNIKLVPARLRIAINSLKNQLPDFWNKEVEEVGNLLNKPNNTGVKKILMEFDVETIAFAIRDARH